METISFVSLENSIIITRIIKPSDEQSQGDISQIASSLRRILCLTKRGLEFADIKDEFLRSLQNFDTFLSKLQVSKEHKYIHDYISKEQSNLTELIKERIPNDLRFWMKNLLDSLRVLFYETKSPDIENIIHRLYVDENLSNSLYYSIDILRDIKTDILSNSIESLLEKHQYILSMINE